MRAQSNLSATANGATTQKTNTSTAFGNTANLNKAFKSQRVNYPSFQRVSNMNSKLNKKLKKNYLKSKKNMRNWFLMVRRNQSKKRK